jgi:hypothetical protein
VDLGDADPTATAAVLADLPATTAAGDPAPPLVTAAELIAYLDGPVDPVLAELVAEAVSAAVAAVVDPYDPLVAAWPPGPRAAALAVAGDVWKSFAAPGGGYQMDDTYATNVYSITSTVLRRYTVLLNPNRAVGGMVG